MNRGLAGLLILALIALVGSPSTNPVATMPPPTKANSSPTISTKLKQKRK